MLRDADARRRRAERRSPSSATPRTTSRRSSRARSSSSGCSSSRPRRPAGRPDPDPAGVDVSSRTCSRWRPPRRSRTTPGSSVLAAIADGSLEPGGRYSVAAARGAARASRARPCARRCSCSSAKGGSRFERNRGVRDPRDHRGRRRRGRSSCGCCWRSPPRRRRAGSSTSTRWRRSWTRWASAPRADDEPGFMDHDERFHELILLAAGNRRLAAIVAGLRDTVRGRGASTVGRSRSLEEIQAEHGAILDALRAGDADRAGAAMRYHLRRTGDLLAGSTAALLARDRRRVGAREAAVDQERRGGDVATTRRRRGTAPRWRSRAPRRSAPSAGARAAAPPSRGPWRTAPAAAAC